MQLNYPIPFCVSLQNRYIGNGYSPFFVIRAVKALCIPFSIGTYINLFFASYGRDLEMLQINTAGFDELRIEIALSLCARADERILRGKVVVVVVVVVGVGWLGGWLGG